VYVSTDVAHQTCMVEFNCHTMLHRSVAFFVDRYSSLVQATRRLVQPTIRTSGARRRRRPAVCITRHDGHVVVQRRRGNCADGEPYVTTCAGGHVRYTQVQRFFLISQGVKADPLL
jgi:hypothetical protein